MPICWAWIRTTWGSASQPESCLLQQGAPKAQLSSKIQSKKFEHLWICWLKRALTPHPHSINPYNSWIHTFKLIRIRIDYDATLLMFPCRYKRNMKGVFCIDSCMLRWGVGGVWVMGPGFPRWIFQKGPDAGPAWKCFLPINNAGFIWEDRGAWLQYSEAPPPPPCVWGGGGARGGWGLSLLLRQIQPTDKSTVNLPPGKMRITERGWRDVTESVSYWSFS